MKKRGSVNPIGIKSVLILMMLLCFYLLSSQVAVAQPIVLGVPISRGYPDGVDAERGITLAVDEINAKGGVNVAGTKRPFKVEISDTRDLEPGVPVSEGLLVVERLIIEEKANFIVGGPIRSEAALAAMDVLSKHKKVSILSAGVLSPAYQKRVAENYEKYKYCFRTTGNVVPMIEGTIRTFESIKAKKGFDSAFIMVQDVAHARAAGTAVKEGLEKKGWKIIGYEVYPTGATDFSVGLSKAKEGKAQYLIPWFDMPEVSILMKQWYDMKVPALPIGYIHALKDEPTWKATDGKVAYSIALYAKAGSVATMAIPMTGAFVSAHKKKYGIEPRSEWTSTSYMVAYILKDAIERAKSLEPDLIIPALEKTDMMGTYGRIKFDPKNHQIIENGDPKETAVDMWAQWLDGKRVIVFPDKIATKSLELPPWMK
ncbi:MAG TPA: ABC transporter substrate-binding protein [Thermodesulfobacteriota bacterium]|nr:ABC transporter substrate-binding protein [Thermodesulfobacteriota bacterium]